MLDSHTVTNKEAVTSLAGEVLTGTERLQRLVENLLDMTRIESGMLHPKRDLCDAEDIIGTVLRRVAPLEGSHPVEVKVAPGTQPIVCDQVLLVQALANIVHNAFVYAPNHTPIEVMARQVGSTEVELTVRDRGPGLPKENPQAVLGKFYRHAPEKTGGIGLGLSIAKGFIELQGGTITATNHPEGGAVFKVTMPSGGANDR
jgi:two-component system sensor histidine kinase KdpD